MQTENYYTENYIEQLKTSLLELNLYLILLFGSYAYGTPHQDCDLDLLVVTNDDFIPKSFKEKHEIYKQVSQKLRPIKSQISVDLIVHTIPMYKKFVQQNSSFAYEIISQGKVIYERNNTGMA